MVNFTRFLGLLESSPKFRVKFILWLLIPFFVWWFYAVSIIFLALFGLPYELLKQL